MPTIQEIVNGIQQAYATSWDGAHDERFTYDGKAHKVGLDREEGDPLIDARIRDGFGIKIRGNQLGIVYNEEMPLRAVANMQLENEVDAKISNIVKFLKREYKVITGNTLGLSPVPKSDVKITVEYISRVRTKICGCRWFNISGIDEPTSEHKLSKAFQDWIALGGQK